MAKTIKQIAAEIGVSKQAVHQRIKRNKDLQKHLQPFISTVDNTVYIDINGERLIKELYSEQSVNIDGDVYTHVDGEKPVNKPFERNIANTVDGNVDINVDGSVYTHVDGEKPVNKPFERNIVNTVDGNVDINVDGSVYTHVDDMLTVLQDTINALQQQLNIKDEQLAVKDKQIEALTSALVSSQQALADTTAALNAAQALHAGTIQQQLEIQSDNTKNEIKEGFFKKILKARPSNLMPKK